MSNFAQRRSPKRCIGEGLGGLRLMRFEVSLPPVAQSERSCSTARPNCDSVAGSVARASCP
eukprot:4787329-Amphidinium_carterae.1